MMRRVRKFSVLLPALTTLALLSGCGTAADEDTPAQQTSAAPQGCHRDALSTQTPGVLTFGTDQPVSHPWFINNQPENGQGYESAVAYAVADKLGYERQDVQWVRVPFHDAVAPGPKNFDALLAQVTITEDRKEAVDFSSPYFNVTHAFLTMSSSPGADATTLDELKSVRLGAHRGTTNYEAAEELSGGAPVAAFATPEDAKTALSNGEIDVLALDLQTAFATQMELPESIIIGQIPPKAGQDQQFGVVLEKDSPLTDCVSKAVDELGDNGDLFRLQKEWIAGPGVAPFLS